MKERPILFSAPMVRAILDGRKTQTRRVVKNPPEFGFMHCGYVDSGMAIQANKEGTCTCREMPCPYGQPGDRLWVRETWRAYGLGTDCLRVASRETIQENLCYRADFDSAEVEKHIRWKPSIFMPKWANRITLEIVAVRVERLNEISEADAIAEGIEPDDLREGAWRPEDGKLMWKGYNPRRGWIAIDDPVESYRSLWESINGDGSWGQNPWVWVIEFRRVE